MTDEILRLVPSVPVFRDSLRCIKLWAQRQSFDFVLQGRNSPEFRSSHLFECHWVFRWSRMGHVGGANMPIVPKCKRWSDCQQILYNLARMVRSLVRIGTSDL